ncbi:TfoX/Sxy family protein [Desulforhopalus sp. 52FAK]
MAVTKGFVDYVLDQLSKWGDVSVKRMFGGAGLYREEKMFALIADDVIYLKVDETNREKFVAAGSTPFKPFPQRPTIMSYYEVPAEVLEDPEELMEWAGESLFIQKRRK